MVAKEQGGGGGGGGGEGPFCEENKCSWGMSKYLYMMAANIDDVASRQQKPPQKLATSAKTTSETVEGGKSDGLNS
jgi:hypothetical protein